MMALAQKNAKLGYMKTPLDSDLQTVCVLLGFWDVLAVKMETSEKSEEE